MANVLYIEANPNTLEESCGKKVGHQFIEEYQKHHPNDTIQKLDLYESDRPTLLDRNVFHSMSLLRLGKDYRDTEGKNALDNILKEVDRFISFDKYVIVSPMWNFGLPPLLKAYIDSIVIVGKTFHYTEKGPVGLLSGCNKKALHIHSSGGLYSQMPFAKFDHSNRYLSDILGFIGIKSFETIQVEGTALPEKEKYLESARVKAQELAATF